MPDRVVRDEILTSERYWSVSIEAQRLYVHLLLVVDDTARFTAKNFTIRTSCFPGQPVDPQRVEKLLEELVAVDLIRMWTDGDERYLFVPRFRQRLRYQKSKFPEPPRGINDIPEQKSDLGQAQARPKSAEVKRSEVKRREEKNNNPPLPPQGGEAASGFVLPDWIPRLTWDDWIYMRKKIRKAPTVRAQQLAVAALDRLRKEGNDPRAVLEQSILNSWQGLFAVKTEKDTKKQDAWWASDRATQAKAAELGVSSRPGESWNEFRARIKAKLEKTA